jgi:ribosomal protein L9
MKIKFVKTAPGRPEYSLGETYEFTGPLEESYARKYMDRGWAVAADTPAKDHVERKTADAEAMAAREAKEKAEYKAKVEAGERGPKARK